MTLPDFNGLLREAMGLDSATIGAYAVESAVNARLTAHGIGDPHAYWELVRTSSVELQALIEAVVVPETWFFRDGEAFAALTRYAANEWLPAHPGETLRLLSLPCSSGEEPYSMAMALLDAGFPVQRYRIDAVDISARVLARARHGVYGKNSFRGGDLAFRARHFIPVSGGYRVNDAVREPVFFRQDNLFADDFLSGAALYDAIFCRNLLIYFDRDTQDQAFHVLQSLLKPEGILFVGPSEGALPLRHHLDSTRIPHSFAFRRRSVTSPPSRRAKAEPVSAVPLPVRMPQSMPAVTATTQESELSVALAELKSDSAVLDEAYRLADQGHLSAAASLCEESLAKHGPSVRAFHLLGLIASATGDLATASSHYRKALYLDKSHYETLAHLSLLLEKEGDVAGARILHDRIMRLQTENRVA